MAFITGIFMETISPSPCPFPWMVIMSPTMSLSLSSAISFLLSPMYAPRQRISLWNGSACLWALQKSSVEMNTLLNCSLLRRILASFRMSLPVWNLTICARLRT